MYLITGWRGDSLLRETACTWDEVQQALPDLAAQGWERVRVRPPERTEEDEEPGDCQHTGPFGLSLSAEFAKPVAEPWPMHYYGQPCDCRDCTAGAAETATR